MKPNEILMKPNEILMKLNDSDETFMKPNVLAKPFQF